MIPTRDARQMVCTQCDFWVLVGRPLTDEERYVAKIDVKKNETSDKSEPATKAERTAAIAAAVAKKKAAGSVAEKKQQATSAGVVKPKKADRPTKIPAKLNGTSGKKKAVDDTDTTTEGSVEDYVKKKADAEMDENVKPKKKAKDPNELSVSDVASECGVDPKRARARLRAAGKTAIEGRWPTVKRGSKEHDELVGILNPPVAPKKKGEDTDGEDVEEDDEEQDDDEEDEE